MSDDVQAFLGTWYDPQEDQDAITVAETGNGRVTISFPPTPNFTFVIDGVVIDGDRLCFDQGILWDGGGANPLAGAEGVPVRVALQVVSADPAELEWRMTSDVLGREFEAFRLRRRPEAGGE